MSSVSLNLLKNLKNNFTKIFKDFRVVCHYRESKNGINFFVTGVGKVGGKLNHVFYMKSLKKSQNILDFEKFLKFVIFIKFLNLDIKT